MAVVRCPGCRAELEVADRLMGEPVACGACGTVFDPTGSPPPVARRAAPPRDEYDGEDDDRPRRRRRRYEDDYDDEDEYYRPPRPDAHPAHLPGLLSAVVCLLGVAYRVIDIVALLAVPGLLKNNPFLFGGPAPPVEALIGFDAFACVWLVVVLAASFRMMSGRNHRFAFAGMLMHLLPCAALCYPLGLGVAIWGLVVLNRPEVRAGFAANDRAAGLVTDEDVDR